MANSVNKRIEGLNQTENFAREIGRGNLDAEFKLLGDKDLLGISLIDMQKSLKHAKEVEEECSTYGIAARVAKCRIWESTSCFAEWTP